MSNTATMKLTQGQNAPLATGELTAAVQWRPDCGIESIVPCAFFVREEGMTRAANDMVHLDKPQDERSSIRIQPYARPRAVDPETLSVVFEIDPSKLPEDVERVFVCGGAQTTLSPSEKPCTLSVRVVDRAGGELSYDVDVPRNTNFGAILGEFYRRGDRWKFRAVGQGFAGGTSMLSKHFGVGAVAGRAAVVETPKKSAGGRIDLTKVSLNEDRPSVSLGKTLEKIRVNLNWNQGVAPTGLFKRLRSGRKNEAVDLDLGCLFVLKNGTAGAVQALGEHFGSYERAPFIHLLGDDRSGSTSEGEWMEINGAHWSDIDLVIVYALIYEGVANWSATDGVVTLHVPGQPQVETRLESTSRERYSAIAMLENRNGSLKVTRVNEYFTDAKSMDQRFRIGLKWKSGSK